MSYRPTRREFLADAAMAGAALTLATVPVQAVGTVSQRRTSFDTGWRFRLGEAEGNADQAAHASGFDDGGWRALDLPHDWSIEGAFAEDAPAKGTGAYLPTGIGWYRKTFTLPHSSAGRQVAIEFDGVYQRSEVFINGISLGMRPYGFISFAYDLTPHLAPPGKPNHLAVRVDNSLQPNCRWYSGSGIYRHTWLTITDPVHIAQWGLCVRTPSITPEAAVVEVTSRILNQGSHAASFEVLTEILDSAGAVLQHEIATNAAPGDGETRVVQTLRLPAPTLWSLASPHLYQVRATVRVNGAPVDQESTTFGVRTIQFDVDRGFLLNGQHVKLNGVCIHGDGGSVGTAVPLRLWERRLTLLQQMGCNAIRLSHNPPAPELLDLLDRMGLLVMAEAFDEWRQPKGQTPVYGYHKYFDEWSERDLTAMLERDRNHPSIVIWSAGNEVPDQSDAQGPATLERLMQLIRANDPTRLITVACDQIAAEPKPALPAFLEKLDVVGYNYVDRWRDRREKFYSIDRHDYPGRRFIGTESSAVYAARGVYAVDQSNELFFERFSNTQIEVEQLQKFIQTYDYVSGDFIWAGIDYLGEARWPNKLAATGPIDTCGFVKDTYYFYQSLWTTEPVLHLSPHWNWPGFEGKVIPVTCFTNCDTVELFLNGRSLGVKGFAFPRPGMTVAYGHYPARAKALQTTADLHLTWDVPYTPGVLMAQGMKDGKVIKTIDVHTTGPASTIALSLDRDHINTGFDDVAHVTVRVLDEQGRAVPTADHAVQFVVKGEGLIVGVDNGQPDSHEPYKASQRKLFSGMALVLLQSSGRAGAMTLSASSPALGSAEVQVFTQARQG